MFQSFFPRPKLFFLSAVLWIAFAIALWYAAGRELGVSMGMAPMDPDNPIIGLGMFLSPGFAWFYVYFAVFLAAFAAFWRFISPHPWWRWSILGSGLIIFVTYIDVQFTVAINNWRGPFFDMVQAALTQSRPVENDEYYGGILQFLYIALGAVILGSLNIFFVAHYVFRWRMAMNNFYIDRWERLRGIEGAAQRVQEDTMRFATITETLGVSLISAVMTLIAFLPVLARLSRNITELPILGEVPHSLVLMALGWSIIGTVWLAAIGFKLPGLNFKNQRVEAAYRKELVFGEDHADRAQPPTLRALFDNVRKNYFRMYFHYLYFNVGRIIYLQSDAIFPYILMGPAILAGKLTLGLMQQILTAFGQVSTSFQYLVNSWTTIVELISIYKRLQGFEATLRDKPLSGIEAEPAV